MFSLNDISDKMNKDKSAVFLRHVKRVVQKNIEKDKNN